MSIVTTQLLDFFQFVIIGILISILFDFFRAYRSARKTTSIMVLIQDILYFFIVTIIVIFSIIYILDSDLRFYIFFAMILGILTYISILSKFFLKLYHKFFKVLGFLFELIVLPLKFVSQFITKIYNYFKKNIQKCCKKFFYMLSLNCMKLKKSKFLKFKIKRRG